MQAKEDFRIIFMGTPDFAVESLKQILAHNFQVVAVVTSPDKPAGRGQKINQSAVKKFADAHGLKTLQPTNLKDPVFQQELKDLQADLQVIVAFRMLPEAVWAMPPLGSINLHASLLPQYRGAAPINWAVINGESQTGATTFFLKHEIDTGNILYQTSFDIGPDDDAGTVHDTLMVNGARLLVETLEKIRSKSYEEQPQESLIDGALKHAPKIFKDDCKVDWSADGQKIHNLIRGLSPYPTAWTALEKPDGSSTSLKIFKARFEAAQHEQLPGTILLPEKERLQICCANGYLEILELQLAGKKRMQTQDMLRGSNQIASYKAV